MSKPKILVIVESPHKAKTITRYLQGRPEADYEVMASQGHIRDLSTHGKGGLGIDVEDGFKPDWEIPAAKKKIVSELSAAKKKADAVYLASDPDREGEAISWHLAEVLKLPVESTTRLQFHEITQPAIENALAHPMHIDMRMVDAQETRRMEDRIIGFKVSSLMQKRVGLQSAGRVQSATLRMVVDKQNEIDAFKPEEYWTIDVVLEIGGKSYKASLVKVDGKPVKLSSKEEAEAVKSRIPALLPIASIKKEEKLVYPRLPFSTSTLQQEAFQKFHFSNKKTQDIAQRLYEGEEIAGQSVGLITYMRTDTTRISPEFYHGHAVPFITETYGKEYVGPYRAFKAQKGQQDAHEAIRPTGTHRTPESVAPYLEPDEAKLYRLIYCRALASMMAPKKVENTTATLVANGLEFSLKGVKTLFPGFEKVYGDFEDKEEAGLLPELKEGQELTVSDIDAEQKFTKAPAPYNEATIVKAMEEKGIGRPSTYATTVDTLINRKYVTATRGVLKPTESGRTAVSVLEEHFPKVVDVGYTAEMENELDRVEAGEKTFLEAMNEFYGPFEKSYEDAVKNMKKAAPQETGENCPLCGKPLVLRKNKRGESFVGCSGWPECHYIKREPKEEPKEVGENCPVCGKPLVYKKNSRGETFIGCSGYTGKPGGCTYTRSLDGKETKKAEKKVYTEADWVKPCPQCKTGHLVVKQGKRVKFLGCTNFPKCRYHEWLDEEKPKKNSKKDD